MTGINNNYGSFYAQNLYCQLNNASNTARKVVAQASYEPKSRLAGDRFELSVKKTAEEMQALETIEPADDVVNKKENTEELDGPDPNDVEDWGKAIAAVAGAVVAIVKAAEAVIGFIKGLFGGDKPQDTPTDQSGQPGQQEGQQGS